MKGVPKIELTGQIFNRLRVTEFVEIRKTMSYWRCTCDCGKVTVVRSYSLTSGNTQSCGCLAKEVAVKTNKTHGMGKSKEFKTWSMMKDRCNNHKNDSYSHYGGRGIEVCDEWVNDFMQFYTDMGPKPTPKHSIERNDVNGNYCKENCRWATIEEQANNRRDNVRITYQGKDMTAQQWGAYLGISSLKIRRRLKKGLSPDKVFHFGDFKRDGKYESA